MVSNAGVEHFGALETITQSDFDRLFQTNVAGQLFTTQAAVKAMSAGGRILLTSSISARIAVYQHTLYAASKSGRLGDGAQSGTRTCPAGDRH
jgi:NAD(P)-dependent dehydrogenase (short-subunit alcohol dehydrogenase family)